MSQQHDMSVNTDICFTHIISKIVNEHKEHFIKFANAESGYSFESWLNIEICLKLEEYLKNKKCAGTVKNESSYKNDTSKRADIIFNEGDVDTILEIKIAHPRTQDKYKFNCKQDIQKLSSLSADEYTYRYFILVVVTTLSEKDFLSDEPWKQWIEYIFKKTFPKLESISLSDPEENKGSVHVYAYDEPFDKVFKRR